MQAKYAEEARKMSAIVLKEPILAFLPAMFRAFPEAEWFLVGGAVRDLILDRKALKDFDLVVRNVTLQDLSGELAALGKVNLVGRTFGVLKFIPEGSADGQAVDIAWPRTERAGMSGGYRDFTVYADPELPIEQDLGRRDFTMNAVALDLRRAALIDPHDGIGDIGRKIVRAVGHPPDRFAEDHSRMLRAIRFACQLGFAIESGTWEALKGLAPRIGDVEGKERIVPYETVAKELLKAIAADPPKCIDLFESSGLLFRLLPELEPLASCPQPKNYHSEGDVWTHTKLALAKLASPGFGEMFPGEAPTAETAVSVLFHDAAKPLTIERQADGGMTYYGHADRGAVIAKAAAERLKLASYSGAGVQPERIGWLVKMHLFPNLVDVAAVKKTTLVRHFLSDRVAGRDLLHLAYADAAATVHEDGTTDLSNLRNTVEAVAAIEKTLAEDGQRPAWLVSGQDVMATVGIAPGPDVGRLLEAVREAQLNGQVASVEQAKELLRKLHG